MEILAPGPPITLSGSLYCNWAEGDRVLLARLFYYGINVPAPASGDGSARHYRVEACRLRAWPAALIPTRQMLRSTSPRRDRGGRYDLRAALFRARAAFCGSHAACRILRVACCVSHAAGRMLRVAFCGSHAEQKPSSSLCSARLPCRPEGSPDTACSWRLLLAADGERCACHPVRP